MRGDIQPPPPLHFLMFGVFMCVQCECGQRKADGKAYTLQTPHLPNRLNVIHDRVSRKSFETPCSIECDMENDAQLCVRVCVLDQI